MPVPSHLPNDFLVPCDFARIGVKGILPHILPLERSNRIWTFEILFWGIFACVRNWFAQHWLVRLCQNRTTATGSMVRALIENLLCLFHVSEGTSDSWPDRFRNVLSVCLSIPYQAADLHWLNSRGTSGGSGVAGGESRHLCDRLPPPPTAAVLPDPEL
jgi:hypothetical protein